MLTVPFRTISLMFFVIRAFPHAEEKAKLILLKLEQKDALHILKQVLNNLSLLTRAVCLNSEAGAGRASLLKSKFQPGQRGRKSGPDPKS